MTNDTDTDWTSLPGAQTRNRVDFNVDSIRPGDYIQVTVTVENHERDVNVDRVVSGDLWLTVSGINAERTRDPHRTVPLEFGRLDVGERAEAVVTLALDHEHLPGPNRALIAEYGGARASVGIDGYPRQKDGGPETATVPEPVAVDDPGPPEPREPDTGGSQWGFLRFWE